MFKVHGHRRLAVRSAFDDPLVHVGLLNDAAVIHFYPCRIIRIAAVLDVCFTNGEWYAAAVMTKQPKALTSDDDRPIFTMYLLIQLGLNSLLNTHHTDIIITSIHHVHKQEYFLQ
jgi:hypothetical protein